jgi:hypothetical protein
VWKDFYGLAAEDPADDSQQQVTVQQHSRPAPSVSLSFREFVDFCHQLCPLPSEARPTLADNRSDGRIQAARRLQCMLERVSSFRAEEGETDDAVRSEKEEEGGSDSGSSDEQEMTAEVAGF